MYTPCPCGLDRIREEVMHLWLLMSALFWGLLGPSFGGHQRPCATAPSAGAAFHAMDGGGGLPPKP
jgi:hypothetical protein